ncbi:activating transcription factor 7-interacting protein 2 isoform X2 [Podarcis raffonei]|uniref:activating transcription factor 7-interacting protein 2 isoform X2 n=2 Tax=Podarcis raffonei TaxID=65483 RepID=UPI002329201F|nr:activating transcription factor 7-interacting protein 2 isoform X2 [Podarcis raffonei]
MVQEINPNMDVKKPLRAKKTMTPSARKQVKMLREMKAVQAAEKMANSTSVVYNHVHLKRAETSGLSQNSLKEPNLQPKSKETLLHPSTLREPVSNLVVNSEMKAVQGAEKLANGTSIVNNHVHLKRSEASGLSQNSLKEPNLQPESKETLLHPPTLREPVTNLVVNSEISIYNSRREGSQDLPYKVCTEDSDLEQFLNAGALQDLLYYYLQKEPSSSSHKPVEVHLNSEPLAQLSGQSEHELSVTSPMRKIPALEKVTEIKDEPLVKQTMPVLEQEGDRFQLLEKNTNSSVRPDGAPRKRRISETNEGILSKCIKKSDEARKVCDKSSEKRHIALEKVKCFIQSQLDKSMKTLDHRLELLKQRIDHTQCLRKHEAIAIKIVKKISRLDRRIDAVITSQKRESSRKALPTRPPLQIEIINCPSPQHSNANSMPAPSKEKPSNLNKTIPKNTESSEDIICLSWGKKSSDVGTVNPTGVQQKETSVNASTSAETPCNSKNPLFIDLTDEGDDSNKAYSISLICQSSLDGTPSSFQYCATKKTDSPVESLVLNHPQPVLQTSNEVPEAFRHLPPLPQVEQQLESLSRFRHTRPPQKLHLTVVQVEKPKGFGLRWEVSKVEPWCAPLDSFHLFVCLEFVGKGVPTRWLRVRDIKAMPLPMGCSLAQIANCSKCYFTIQSKDIYGRYGPFSDIHAISMT